MKKFNICSLALLPTLVFFVLPLHADKDRRIVPNFVSELRKPEKVTSNNDLETNKNGRAKVNSISERATEIFSELRENAKKNAVKKKAKKKGLDNQKAKEIISREDEAQEEEIIQNEMGIDEEFNVENEVEISVEEKETLEEQLGSDLVFDEEMNIEKEIEILDEGQATQEDLIEENSDKNINISSEIVFNQDGSAILTCVNSSGFSNDEVYVQVLGINPTTGNECFISLDANSSSSYIDADEQVNSSDFSYTLSSLGVAESLDNVVIHLPVLNSIRLFFSISEKLLFEVSLNDAGTRTIKIPDSNDETIWNKIEFTNDFSSLFISAENIE